MGHDLNLQRAFGASALGRPLLAEYGDSFSRAVWENWVIMGGFALLLLAAACYILARRTGPARPAASLRERGEPGDVAPTCPPCRPS